MKKIWQNLKALLPEWKFKHPTPNDFIRVAEKVSGAELSWYLNDWTRTTNTVDYSIKSVEAAGNGSEIVLERIGQMPMPIEVEITFTDGEKEENDDVHSAYDDALGKRKYGKFWFLGLAPNTHRKVICCKRKHQEN